MERFLVAIDAGTTNTRVSLWNAGGQCLDTVKAEVGVRNTAIDGNNSRLREAVRDCLAGLLAAANLTWDRVVAVYASGMITSNVGLVDVPHLIAPAGREDFIRGVKTVSMPEVSPLPIHFIPGLKNMAGPIAAADVEAMDIMRGEETETLALLDRFPRGEEYLFILPGSHTKFVTVDREGRMTGCLTSLAGELLAGLTKNSILADAVGREFVERGDYDRARVLLGFRTARATSLARAAFSTRIMSMFVEKNPKACANFLLGAVLENDVAAVKTSRALRTSPDAIVVVAGKEPLRGALADVFAEDGHFRSVRLYESPDNAALSGLGVFIVAKARENW